MRSSTGYPPIPKVKLVIAGQWEPHGNGRVLRLYFTLFRFERLRRGSGMEFVLAWILGFVLTSGFVVWVLAKLFHRHVLKPLLVRPLPPLRRPPPVSSNGIQQSSVAATRTRQKAHCDRQCLGAQRGRVLCLAQLAHLLAPPPPHPPHSGHLRGPSSQAVRDRRRSSSQPDCGPLSRRRRAGRL